MAWCAVHNRLMVAVCRPLAGGRTVLYVCPSCGVTPKEETR